MGEVLAVLVLLISLFLLLVTAAQARQYRFIVQRFEDASEMTEAQSAEAAPINTIVNATPLIE